MDPPLCVAWQLMPGGVSWRESPQTIWETFGEVERAPVERNVSYETWRNELPLFFANRAGALRVLYLDVGPGEFRAPSLLKAALRAIRPRFEVRTLVRLQDVGDGALLLALLANTAINLTVRNLSLTAVSPTPAATLPIFDFPFLEGLVICGAVSADPPVCPAYRLAFFAAEPSHPSHAGADLFWDNLAAATGDLHALFPSLHSIYSTGRTGLCALPRSIGEIRARKLVLDGDGREPPRMAHVRRLVGPCPENMYRNHLETMITHPQLFHDMGRQVAVEILPTWDVPAVARSFPALADAIFFVPQSLTLSLSTNAAFRACTRLGFVVHGNLVLNPQCIPDTVETLILAATGSIAGAEELARLPKLKLLFLYATQLSGLPHLYPARHVSEILGPAALVDQARPWVSVRS